ncbi:MAG: alpha/beta fold hydrolase [Gammaproteobacteria bacterium]
MTRLFGTRPVLLGLGFALTLFWAASATAYDYPIADPFLATVVGTPAPLKAPVPTDVPFRRRSIRVLEREAPDALWYDQELRYSYAAQRGPAPLVFTIAGTGAAHDGSKNWLAARAFYSKGFHVVALGSPVSANFVVAASSSGVPGGAFDDARDLYRAMQKIRDELQGKLEITDYYLAGYSLGAFNAAHVSYLDAEQNVFDFRRVLMMNPPVRLYSSISLLDRMLDNIPGGPDNFDAFYERIVDAVGQAYRRSDSVRFDEELLFKAFEVLRPTDELLASLIGLVFRIASANMAFTSDVMTDFGFIKPSNVRLTRNTDLGVYNEVAMRLGFTDYFHAYFYPYQANLEPGLSRSELIERMSLVTIGDYLRGADDVYLIHNADDLILEAGEIELLQDMFGERATIFPRGGHMGNMESRDYIGRMLSIMDPGATP